MLRDLLKCGCNGKVSGSGENNSGNDACTDIQREQPVVFIEQKDKIVLTECGECCKRAEKPRYKQHVGDSVPAENVEFH